MNVKGMKSVAAFRTASFISEKRIQCTLRNGLKLYYCVCVCVYFLEKLLFSACCQKQPMYAYVNDCAISALACVYWNLGSNHLGDGYCVGIQHCPYQWLCSSIRTWPCWQKTGAALEIPHQLLDQIIVCWTCMLPFLLCTIQNATASYSYCTQHGLMCNSVVRVGNVLVYV